MEKHEFLKKLNKVKGSGNQFTACCPAHDDKNASLSISTGNNGKILLKCHAGCTTEAVLKSMDLTTKDLFSEEKVKSKKRTVVEEYIYTNVEGEAIHKKIRYDDKTFSQAHLNKTGKWEFNLQGVTPLLYNLLEVVKGIKDGKNVYIVEGEKDANNLIKCGRIATTNTHGAGPNKWLQHYNDYLHDSSVIIISDNDNVGKDFSLQIANSLSGKTKSLKVVDLSNIWKEVPEHGDITDFIYKFGKTQALNMLDKYVEELNEYIPREKDKEAGSIEEMFAGSGYAIHKGCTALKTEKTDGSMDVKLLSNFVAWCEGESTTDDGLDVLKTFNIKGKHSNGTSLPVINVNAMDFSNMNWVTKLWGFNCNMSAGSNTKDRLRHCIQSISKDIKEETVYLHTGWRNHNGNWIYLHGDGSVGEENINVKLEGKLSHYKLPKADPDKYKEAIMESLKLLDIGPKNITLPLLAFAFLSPLNEFLKQAYCEPKTVYFLMGKTGSGKSTITALFLSFFGKFNNTSLPCSFLDTANAVVSQTFLAKDNLICIDDLKPSNKNDSSRMDNTAQVILRAYGERTGRSRLNSSSQLMGQRIPRGNPIITGEIAPNVGESGTARMVVSEIHKGDVDFSKVTVAQSNVTKGIYGVAMLAYIESLKLNYIDTNVEGFTEYLAAEFDANRNIMAAKLKKEVHPRFIESCAHLLIGIQFFTYLCIDNKALTTKEADSLIEDLKEILIEMSEEHIELSRNDKPSEKFIVKLRELINTEQAYVENINNAYSSFEYGKGNRPFIGFYDDQNYYLFAETTYKSIVDFCNKAADFFPVGLKTLIKHLADERLIVVENGENTPRRTIQGKRNRFMIIPKIIIDEEE